MLNEILHRRKPVKNFTIWLCYIFCSWLTKRSAYGYKARALSTNLDTLFIILYFGNLIRKEKWIRAMALPSYHWRMSINWFVYVSHAPRMHLRQNSPIGLSTRLFWMEQCRISSSSLNRVRVVRHWHRGHLATSERDEKMAACVRVVKAGKCWLNTGDSSIEGHTIESSVRYCDNSSPIFARLIFSAGITNKETSCRYRSYIFVFATTNHQLRFVLRMHTTEATHTRNAKHQDAVETSSSLSQQNIDQLCTFSSRVQGVTWLQWIN